MDDLPAEGMGREPEDRGGTGRTPQADAASERRKPGDGTATGGPLGGSILGGTATAMGKLLRRPSEATRKVADDLSLARVLQSLEEALEEAVGVIVTQEIEIAALAKRVEALEGAARGE